MAISAGCPSGVGPEILVAALKHPKVRRALTPLVFGDASLGRLLPSGQLVAVTRLAAKDRKPGAPTRASGRAQLAYVEAAVAVVKEAGAQALCTAPVSKEQITRSGIRFMGHTELLADRFGCEVLMLMDGPRLKVALATNHLPLAQVPGALNIPNLVRQLQLLSHALGKKPRLAVCGLNPHAGEGGELGREEVEIIGPAIARARRKGVDCHGPFAADGLFARVGPHFGFDAVLAMFHDQGLVAAKTLDFERTVNVTLGLPVVRTSPDHGTAYDIAGKGKADPAPMIAALLRAVG
ncbi:MAG: pdxA [Myxococcaceae bacterium]|nr:pdxA [Myxococcaceae bacterium]